MDLDSNGPLLVPSFLHSCGLIIDLCSLDSPEKNQLKFDYSSRLITQARPLNINQSQGINLRSF